LDKNFTVLLKQFIDCYIADPLAVEVHLRNAQQDIDSDVFGEQYEGEADARDLSLKNAYRALEERLFAEPSSTDVAGRNSRMSSGEEPRAAALESSQKKWKEWEEQRFQAFLNKLAWSLDMPRESLDGWIAEEGFTRDQLAEVERDPEWRKKEAKYDFGVDSEPNMQVFLAREFAAWLDVAVAKIERVEEAPYRAAIPMHLRQHLHEAYRCDLYGLDAASAALCGSILEEAIRFTLDVKASGLGNVIEEARKRYLLTPELAEHAREVMRLRNHAAHGSRQFADSAEDQRKSLLAATRGILDTLFAKES
jgi:hypothetical protein